MIRLLTASTFEIDDPQLAAEEIKEQLDVEHSLLANVAGLLFCSPDFIKSGAAAAVAKALPFETIGCTTHGIAVPGAMGEAMLTAVALTSDDIFFKTGVSDALDGSEETPIRELYERVSDSMESPPFLMFMCHPNPKYFFGDRTLHILDSVSGRTPVFGTYALDATIGNKMPMVIHNETASLDRVALLALYGGVLESRFTVKNLPAMNFQSQPALVTDARDNRIISVNNTPAFDFMEKAGIISKSSTSAVYGFPLLINNNDGTGPKTCAIHSVEEGGVLCCGSAIAKGATLKIVNQMQKEVLRSSEQLIESIKNEGDAKAHLIFSCFGRSAPLLDLKDEMDLFQKNMQDIPYVFVYSGGEFCPVYDEQGEIHNCFHQYSIISLSL
jgi:hypothetical protein